MMKMSAAAAAAAQTHFPSTNLHCRSAALHRRGSLFSTRRFPFRSSFSVRMSTSDSNSNQIVEHIVLFKVKPSADASAVNAMVTNLNGLSSLDSVLHISTGPVSKCRSNSLAFTHMLHSRYRSKTDLTAYAEHPDHVGVVSNYVKPIVDDVMAVDWIANEFPRAASVSVPLGSALRLTVFKLKENAGEAGKRQVLEFARGIREKTPSIQQLTVGENFSPGRAKGYSICSMAVFKAAQELKNSESESEIANAQVGELIDDVLVLDYAVEAWVRAANL